MKSVLWNTPNEDKTAYRTNNNIAYYNEQSLPIYIRLFMYSHSGYVLLSKELHSVFHFQKQEDASMHLFVSNPIAF